MSGPDGRTWHEKHKDDLTFGQRAADTLRNGMGSWAFIGMFVAAMALWIVWNS